MSLSEIIQSRRSIFPPQFTAQEVSDTDITTILEAANWAPNHAKTEPWRFKVLQGVAKERLGDFLSNKYLEVTVEPKAAKAEKIKSNTIPNPQ